MLLWWRGRQIAIARFLVRRDIHDMRIGIIGGTGREGRGLALRWARAGHQVLVGSREAGRAVEKAAELSAMAAGGPRIEGGSNEDAARAGEVAVLAVPYPAHGETLRGLRQALAGRILIDITVPLAPPRVTRVSLPAGGAAALEAQALLDPTTRVVAALHHLSSAHLGDLTHTPDCDVLVCGDDEGARTTAIALCTDLGVRALDAGVLQNAVALESLTPVLLHLNRRYSTNAGLRITGIG
jgi:NADPH-dependent F420 reductase